MVYSFKRNTYTLNKAELKLCWINLIFKNLSVLFCFNSFPEPNDAAMGFTAYATIYRPYAFEDVVIFDGIVSNFGGNYHTNSSIYICPKSGVYGFGTSIMNGGSNYYMNIRIMREKSVVVGLQVQRIPDYGNTGATLTVSECLAGEKIWVLSSNDDIRLHGDDTRKSVFYGFLLHQY